MHKAINVVSQRRAIVIVAASGVRGALIYIELDSGHTPFNSIVRVVVVVVVVRHTHRARTIAVARAREDAVRLPRALAAFASGGARVVTFQFKSLYLFKTVGDARARACRDGCVAIARAFEQNEKNI